MFPPPYLTFGMVFFGSYSALFFLQTRWVKNALNSILGHLTTALSPTPSFNNLDAY